MFYTSLLPLIPLLVEVVHVEAVEVTQDNNITVRASSSYSEFLTLLIRGVVEPLEQITKVIIE